MYYTIKDVCVIPGKEHQIDGAYYLRINMESIGTSRTVVQIQWCYADMPNCVAASQKLLHSDNPQIRSVYSASENDTCFLFPISKKLYDYAKENEIMITLLVHEKETPGTDDVIVIIVLTKGECTAIKYKDIQGHDL